MSQDDVRVHMPMDCAENDQADLDIIEVAFEQDARLVLSQMAEDSPDSTPTSKDLLQDHAR